MKASLLGTSSSSISPISGPLQHSASFIAHYCPTSVFSCEKRSISCRGISICSSESSQSDSRFDSRPTPAMLLVTAFRDYDMRGYARNCHPIGFSQEDLSFTGGGMNKTLHLAAASGGGEDELSGSDFCHLGSYYEEFLEAEPTNSMILRNYAKYLHEVERDLIKAEKYYGRAIIASPGDGEVLSSYGKLIWEKDRDEDRATFYFDQAIRASPNDILILGSYAHFLWEVEEQEEKDQGI